MARSKIIHIYSLCLLLCFAYTSNGATFDTTNLVLNAKMNIVPFKGSYLTLDFLKKIIDAKCSLKFLKSKGFDSVVFFKISINSNAKDEFSIYMTHDIGLNDYDYIFGYNNLTGELLLLKGFHEDNFKSLYLIAELHSFEEDMNTTRTFCKTHFVEDLDIACLYEYYNTYATTGGRRSDFKCLLPNTLISFNVWNK